MAVSVASLLYTVVIAKQKHDTHAAYLLGYGVIIPFWILSPLYLIRAFGMTNTVFRFVMGTIPTLALFRTLEGTYL